MGDAPPSWREVIDRVNKVDYRTVTGTIRYHDPDGGRADRGEGWGAEPVDGVNRFWHAAPDRWRVENERGPYHLQDGEWLHIRDEDGRMQRWPQRRGGWGFSYGHPWTLFGNHLDRGTLFTDDDDFSVPTGPPVAINVAGRQGWEFELAPPARKQYPLRVAVDDATGLLIRQGVRETGHYAEMVEFHVNTPIADDLFTWDGPLSTDWWDGLDRDDQ